MIVVDTARGLVLQNPEIKSEVAGSAPYAEWIAEHRLYIGESDWAPAETAIANMTATQRSSATRLRMPA